MGEWISSLCLWSRGAWNIDVIKVKSVECGERWLEITKSSDNHSAQAKLQVSSWDACLEICVRAVLGHSVMSNSLQPHGLEPARLLCPWSFLGKNTGVSCHFLFQRIFLTQGSNSCLLCLLHWQADSLPLHDLESRILGLLVSRGHSVDTVACPVGGLVILASLKQFDSWLQVLENRYKLASYFSGCMILGGHASFCSNN